MSESHPRWGRREPSLVALGLWVFELFAMYRQTDRQINGRTDKSNAYCSAFTVVGIINTANTLTCIPPLKISHLRTSPYAKCCSIPCKVPHRRPPPSPRLPFPLPLGKATKIQIYSASATDTVYAAYYWYAPSTSDESPKPPLEIHSNESLILLRTPANPQIPHTHTHPSCF